MPFMNEMLSKTYINYEDQLFSFKTSDVKHSRIFNRNKDSD